MGLSLDAKLKEMENDRWLEDFEDEAFPVEANEAFFDEGFDSSDWDERFGPIFDEQGEFGDGIDDEFDDPNYADDFSDK